MKTQKILLAVLAVLFLLTACTQKSTDQAETQKDTNKTNITEKADKHDSTSEAINKKDALDSKAKASATPEKIKFSGSHILIAYKGAMRAPENVTRTKEEAEKLATKLCNQLAKKPSEFENLARKYSSCPSGKSGGDLGSWNKGEMIPAFDEAIEKLEVGAISKKPVETSFGFHIIRRNENMKKEEVAAQQIMITYKGALAVDPNITRSREDALKIAKEVAALAKKDPANFKELSKKYNDAPSERLPIWTTGGRMPRDFDKTVMSLKIDQVSDPVETPFGFHIFKRIKVVHRPKMSASHIMISYKGAKMASPTTTRTKAEAIKRAKELLEEAKKDPGKFKDLALKYSEDPGVTLNGGNLGVWEEGDMLPQFEEVLQKLKIGEVGGPVTSINGVHILKRELPKEK